MFLCDTLFDLKLNRKTQITVLKAKRLILDILCFFFQKNSFKTNHNSNFLIISTIFTEQEQKNFKGAKKKIETIC